MELYTDAKRRRNVEDLSDLAGCFASFQFRDEALRRVRCQGQFRLCQPLLLSCCPDDFTYLFGVHYYYRSVVNLAAREFASSLLPFGIQLLGWVRWALV